MTQFYSRPDQEEFDIIELVRLIESGNEINSFNTKDKQNRKIQTDSTRLIYSLSRNKEKTEVEPLNYIDLGHNITLGQVRFTIEHLSSNASISSMAAYNVIKDKKIFKKSSFGQFHSVFILKNHLTKDYRFLVVRYTNSELVIDRHCGFPYIETTYPEKWEWSVYTTDDNLAEVKLNNLRLWYAYKE